MPTKIDSSNLKAIGKEKNEVEVVVNKADNTLASVERIAGKVENIVGMLQKFKEMGTSKNEPTSIAPKIEAGVSKGLQNKVTGLKNTASIKINFKSIEEQLNKLLNVLDDKKTVKDIKNEIKQFKDAGMLEKSINKFIIDNCEVVFK